MSFINNEEKARLASLSFNAGGEKESVPYNGPNGPGLKIIVSEGNADLISAKNAHITIYPDIFYNEQNKKPFTVEVPIYGPDDLNL